jgi:hypothetical protein
MKCSVCGNTGDKNDKSLFIKNGFNFYSKKRKIQRYRCNNCYSTIQENNEI